MKVKETRHLTSRILELAHAVEVETGEKLNRIEIGQPDHSVVVYGVRVSGGASVIMRLQKEWCNVLLDESKSIR